MATKNIENKVNETVNDRLREIIEVLESSDYKIGEAMGMAVSSVSIFTSKLRPKKMTFEFADRFLECLPFVNKEYFIKGFDDKGMSLKMFSRALTKDEKKKFKKTYGTASKLSSSVNKDICDRVFHLRSRLEETQLSFAEKLGVVRWSVTAIEGGRQNPSLAFIQKLKEVFNVSLDWLLMEQGDMFTQESSQANNDKVEELTKEIETLKMIVNKLARV